MFLIALLTTLFSIGDTYSLNDNIKFRDEVVTFAGASLQSPIDPVQVSGYFGTSNYFISLTGTIPNRSSHMFPLDGDVLIDSQYYWYASYIGYIPGELRLDFFEEIFEIKPLVAIGFGWDKTVIGYQRTKSPTYSGGNSINETFTVSALNRWNFNIKPKIGLMLDYSRFGVLVSIGRGYNFEIGIHTKLN